jgi:hemerythrin
MAYTFTTWTDDLVTGSDVIDDQHKQLVDAVNNLFDAQRSGKGQREVQRTLNFLLEYTVKHFSDEEALQEEYGYPGYAAHKQIHTEFKAIAQELAQEYQGKPSDALIKHITTVVGRWVIHHIKDEDKKMALYVLSRMQGEENALPGAPAHAPTPPPPAAQKKGFLRSLLRR